MSKFSLTVSADTAKVTGDHFVDEYTPEWIDPTQAVVSGEERAEMTAMLGPEADGGDGDEALMNRGMRLNEAKKRKRERQLEEQAVQAQFTTENGAAPDTKDDVTNGLKSPPRPKPAEATQKKRKRETSPPVPAQIDTLDLNLSDQPSMPAPSAKRLKITIPAVTKTEPATLPDSIVLLSAGSAARSPAVVATSSAKSPGLRSRHGSSAPEGTLNARKSSTKITIKPSKAASAEPPARRVSLRRGSNASLPGSGKLASPALEAAPPTGRNGRRKRPAPGLVTTEEDGSAKVIVGKRKAAPRKKIRKEDEKDNQPAPTSAVEPEEYIDPNEARYCVCGDVSWGTMIACDNDDVSPFLQSPHLKRADGSQCEKEWFHLDCVDLKEMPPRRTKWYCPDCRKKLKLGQTTNGIVKS